MTVVAGKRISESRPTGFMIDVCSVRCADVATVDTLLWRVDLFIAKCDTAETAAVRSRISLTDLR